MATCDKYKLYGELTKELYALGYNFAQIVKVLADAFPSPGGDAAPPGAVTVASWYKKDAANWDAAKQVRTSYAATVRGIYERVLAYSAAKKERAEEDGAELCSKWFKHLKEIEDRELEKPVNLLKKLHRDTDDVAAFAKNIEWFVKTISTLDSKAADALRRPGLLDEVFARYKEELLK